MDHEKILLKEKLSVYLKNNDIDQIIEDLSKTNSTEFVKFLKNSKPRHFYQNEILNHYFKYEDDLCLEELLLMRSLSRILEENNKTSAVHYISESEYEFLGEEGLYFVISLLREDFAPKISFFDTSNPHENAVELKIFRNK